jgi:hypothetical protein
MSPTKRQLDRVNYAHVEINFERIVGKTYEKVVERINQQEITPPVWDGKLTEEEKTYCLSKLREDGLQLDPVDEATANTRNYQKDPQDEHINFGFKEYDYDNRTYGLLPSNKYMLDPVQHLESFTRAHYKIAAETQTADEMAYYVVDEHEFVTNTIYTHDYLRNKLVPYKKNPTRHLYPQECSVLSGGHPVRINGPNLVHQFCHTDAEQLDNELADKKGALFGKQKPLSAIMPLDTSRSIYHISPAAKITTVKGEIMLFGGDFKHGGLTFTELEWQSSLHWHIDSSHHARESKGLLLEQINRDIYRPRQHMLFLSQITRFKTFVDDFKEFHQAHLDAIDQMYHYDKDLYTEWLDDHPTILSQKKALKLAPANAVEEQIWETEKWRAAAVGCATQKHYDLYRSLNHTYRKMQNEAIKAEEEEDRKAGRQPSKRFQPIKNNKRSRGGR